MVGLNLLQAVDNHSVAVGIGVVRVVVDNFYRVTAPGDFHYRGIIEVAGKFFHIDGCRGNDNFQVRPLGQQVFQVAEQKINIQASLVGLINNQGVVFAEVAVILDFGQQNTVGHQFDIAVRRTLVGEAHLVAHPLSQ